jgi:two-component system phosphate regulon sensor histidine kinase PhoR
MKFHEPGKLALLNAVWLTIIFSVIFGITAGLFFEPVESLVLPLVVYILSAGVLFLSTYHFFRFTLDKFIYSKIRLIYKTIHAVKSGKKELQVTRSEKMSIDRVQDEVVRWGAEKTEETEKLRVLEQYRREFIGNLSHEMKTPLFNIQGYVSTLIDGGLDDPSINLEYLKRTEKSVERLVQILEDLDEITQLESGQLKLNMTRFDLVELTREVTEMLEMKAVKKEIQILINDSGKPVQVEGDKDKVRQVLTNIIDNSLRYGHQGHGRTKITFFDMDEYILTEITDNGIGIDQQDISRVFERFYRTERGRATSRKGKGLGLSIVKHIVEAHGQTVHVRSAVNVGTTFGFTLKKC